MKSKEEIMKQTVVGGEKSYLESDSESIAAESAADYSSKEALEEVIKKTKKRMQEVSKDLDFSTAAELRDKMLGLRALLKEKFG